ncbi:13419_t:CDS:1, partial [Cetraspora pellucida]
MSISLDINEFFDIDEIEKVNMNIDNNNTDVFNSILDSTDGTGHVWKVVENDDKILETKRIKTYLLS